MNFKIHRFLFVVFFCMQPIFGAALATTLDLSSPISAILIKGEVDGPQISRRTGRIWQRYEVDQLLSTLYLTGDYSWVTAYTIGDSSTRQLVIDGKKNATLHTIIFKGNRAISDTSLLSAMTLSPGSPLNYSKLDRDRETILTIYATKGYDLAKIDDISTSENNLIITLSEGHISTLNIQGLSSISPFVVMREFRLKSGDVFNSKFLREDRERLLRLGYFSNISYPKLTPDTSSSNTVGVSFQFLEQKVNLLDLGLEQEENKAVLFMRNNWNHVLINSDQLSGKIQYGSESQDVYSITSYAVNYRQPWFLNQIPASLELDIWEEFREEFFGNNPTNQTLAKNKRKGLQIGSTIPLITDQLSFIIRGKSETVDPLSSGTNLSLYALHSLSAQFFYRDYASLNNPKNGLSWALELEKGGNFGVFDLQGLDFIRTGVNISHFVSVNTQDTIGLHGFMGVFDSNGSALTTFEPEAYTLGGANSLRGYKETEALFGSRKLLFNCELRHDFSKDIQGILFYDIGRVFNSGQFLTDKAVHTGRGFGLRYFTPIAPLRLDFAWGEASGLIIHFGLGQVF